MSEIGPHKEALTQECEKTMLDVVCRRREYGRACIDLKAKITQYKLQLLKADVENIPKLNWFTKKVDAKDIDYSELRKQYDLFSTELSQRRLEAEKDDEKLKNINAIVSQMTKTNKRLIEPTSAETLISRSIKR